MARLTVGALPCTAQSASTKTRRWSAFSRMTFAKIAQLVFPIAGTAVNDDPTFTKIVMGRLAESAA
jgi:hypothetical protein